MSPWRIAPAEPIAHFFRLEIQNSNIALIKAIGIDEEIFREMKR